MFNSDLFTLKNIVVILAIGLVSIALVHRIGAGMTGEGK